MTESYQEPPQQSPQPEQPRKLKRSRNDQVIGGVAGGLGQYFGLDPVLVRIAFVLLVLAGGSGVLLYIVLWIVMPEAEEGEEAEVVRTDRPELGGLILGGAMVALGLLFLLRRFFSWLDSEAVWAILLIALGAYVLMKGVRR